MKITVTYDVDEEMIEIIEELLKNYKPDDFKNQDDREVFLADIAYNLMFESSLLEEPVNRMLEEYLKQKGWIK